MNLSKYDYYLNIAKEISKASKCLRSHFGAIIVKNDMIIGAGYNGPARGVEHCSPCRRINCPSGVGYEKCIAVHAEANAIIQAGGRVGCLGATMYIASHNKNWDGTIYNVAMGDFPCNNCARLIINSGIEWVVHLELCVDGSVDIGEDSIGQRVMAPRKVFAPKCYNVPELVRYGKLW